MYCTVVLLLCLLAFAVRDTYIPRACLVPTLAGAKPPRVIGALSPRAKRISWSETGTNQAVLRERSTRGYHTLPSCTTYRQNKMPRDGIVSAAPLSRTQNTHLPRTRSAYHYLLRNLRYNNGKPVRNGARFKTRLVRKVDSHVYMQPPSHPHAPLASNSYFHPPPVPVPVSGPIHAPLQGFYFFFFTFAGCFWWRVLRLGLAYCPRFRRKMPWLMSVRK